MSLSMSRIFPAIGDLGNRISGRCRLPARIRPHPGNSSPVTPLDALAHELRHEQALAQLIEHRPVRRPAVFGATTRFVRTARVAGCSSPKRRAE